MKKLFSFLVVLCCILAGYCAQAQCNLVQDSVIAGDQVGSYSVYTYANNQLGLVTHVEAGTTNPYATDAALYTGSDLTDVITHQTHGSTDTIVQVIHYTWSGGKITRIDVIGDTASANPWSMSHDIHYNGNDISEIVLDQSSITGQPKGITASFTNFVWSSGNVASVNLVLPPDTVGAQPDTLELQVTQTDTKKNIYKHLLGTDGAPYLFLSASANNILKVILVNAEVVGGHPVPAGSLIVNDSLSYDGNDEVVERAEGQALFTDHPKTTHYKYTCVSGIASPALATAVSIFPNPTSDFIRLEGENFRGVVKIFDIAGKEVRSENISGSISSLDVRGLKAGIYSIEMTDNNNLFRGKFLKN